jgi:hypothetical protein
MEHVGAMRAAFSVSGTLHTRTNRTGPHTA